MYTKMNSLYQHPNPTENQPRLRRAVSRWPPYLGIKPMEDITPYRHNDEGQTSHPQQSHRVQMTISHAFGHATTSGDLEPWRTRITDFMP